MSAYFAVVRSMNVDQMTEGFSPAVDGRFVPAHPFHPTASAVSAEVPAHGGSLTEGEVGPARFINPLLALSQSDEDLTAVSLIFYINKHLKLSYESLHTATKNHLPEWDKVR